ncbi:MAG: SLBB domain-containing protein, partial [Fimbriimonadales bacterium]|nr:SLBB domain-containing protein [Fimbriimonadales bacterium]
MRGLLACLSLALLTSLMAQRTEGAYRLQPEDVIRVQIVGEPEFSAPQLRISRDGRISLPSIGEIQAAGLTLTELEQRIRQRFREEQILRDALVAVTILEFHRPRVSVLGFVLRPGTYEFKEGDRVLDALSQGGGVNVERARLEAAWLQRIDGTKIELNLYRLLYEGDLSQNIPLQDGDTIYVPEETQNRYFVGGQVKRPGLYTWRPGLTVLDALSQAAWETERARLSHTFVVRRKPDGSEERIRVDMVRLLNKGDMKQNIEL